MAVIDINIGSGPDDRTADTIRTAFQKAKDNFADLDARTLAGGADLASTTEATKGSGMVGYNPALAYPPGTPGRAISDLAGSTRANTTAEAVAGLIDDGRMTPASTRSVLMSSATYALDLIPYKRSSTAYDRPARQKLGDYIHLLDYIPAVSRAAAAAGTLDITTYLQNAVNAVGDAGGGFVDVKGGRWLIDSADIIGRANTIINGPVLNFGRRNGGNYSADTGVLVLNPAYSIQLMGVGSGISNIGVYRKGLSTPATLRQAIDLAKSFAGTAIKIGDGTPYTCPDAYVSRVLLLGFELGILNDYNDKSHIEHVRGDCTNGIRIAHSYDMQHMRACHFWPYLTAWTWPATTAVAGAANNGAGLIRLTTAAPHGMVTGDKITAYGVGGVPAAFGRWTATVVNATTLDLQGSTFGGAYTSGGSVVLSAWHRYGVAYDFQADTDWAQATDCFGYGYDVGFSVNGCDHVALINCGADNVGQSYDLTPIGFRITDALGCKLVTPKSAANGRGIVCDVGPGNALTLVGPDTWGIRDACVDVLSGRVLFATPQMFDAPVGIRVAPTSDGIVLPSGGNARSVATPLVISGAALEKSIIGPQTWTDITTGPRSYTDNSVRTVIDTDFSNSAQGRTLVYRKARGGVSSPLVAADGDTVRANQYQIWDGVSAWRVAAQDRVVAYGTPGPGNSGGQYLWSVTPNGGTSPVDTLALRANVLSPVTTDVVDLGGPLTRFRTVYATSLDIAGVTLDGTVAAPGITSPAIRTIPNKAADYIDLRDWDGLDLTGANDNASLVQRACNDISTLTNKPKLNIPAGDIVIDSFVDVTDCMVMDGQPPLHHLTNSTGAREIVGGTRFHITHSGIGFRVRSADGVTDQPQETRLSNLLTYRDQPASTSGWDPANHAEDFRIEARVTLDNVMLWNPTDGVRVRGAGVLTTNELKGQPLRNGIIYERSADVNRHSGLHFWPYWTQDVNILQYTSTEGVGVRAARCDGLKMINPFCIWYNYMFWFEPDSAIGPGGVLPFKLVNPYADQANLLRIISDDSTCWGSIISPTINSNVNGAGWGDGPAIHISGAVPSQVGIIYPELKRAHDQFVLAEGSAHTVLSVGGEVSGWSNDGGGSPAFDARDGASIKLSPEPNFGAGTQYSVSSGGSITKTPMVPAVGGGPGVQLPSGSYSYRFNMANDTAVSFPAPAAEKFCEVKILPSAVPSTTFPIGEVWCRATGSPSAQLRSNVSNGVTTSLVAGVGVHTGATGTVGKFTVAPASDGNIYLENRITTSVIVDVSVIGH